MKTIIKSNFLRLITPVNETSYFQSDCEERKMFSTYNKKQNIETLILLRESEISKKGTFNTFAKRFRPSYVIDLRSVPRLDLLAGSRALAFRLFEELDIEYFDFFGRLEIGFHDNLEEIENHLIKSFHSICKKQKNVQRPLVLFFDNESLLQNFRQTLPQTLISNSNSLNRCSFSITEYKSGFLSVNMANA